MSLCLHRPVTGKIARCRYNSAMPIRTLAHLSDLHIGLSSRMDRVAAGICQALLESEVDHVVVTGDVTNGGSAKEIRRFHDIFRPLLATGKISVIPGNHDRVGLYAWQSLTGRRAEAEFLDGLYLVKVDSTGVHNQSVLFGHGELDGPLIDEVVKLLERAPADALCAVLIHHHLLPLPVETFVEWFSSRMRWPFARELSLGHQLLSRSIGLCDLVLHGHRHVPREGCFSAEPRRLGVYNAGSSTELCAYRLFRHAEGRLIGAPAWIEVTLPRARRWWGRPQIAPSRPYVLE
jgi:3',5'-cyclic AMP phosphodiesterase CpdA